MTPYYEDEATTIYHGDCRVVLPDLNLSPLVVVISDPPYGIGVNTANRSRGRGKPSDRSTHVAKGRLNRISASRDYPPVYGDDEPFDPSHLMRFKRLVLWGANNYADKLPPTSSWLVWDRDSGTSDTADAELAWTNLGGTVRSFTYGWNGAFRQGEKDTHGWHPTQKPVALFRWIIERWTRPDDVILDPYMGSGPTLRAAKDLGRRSIGIEIEEPYCAVAARRLGQDVLDLGGTA